MQQLHIYYGLSGDGQVNHTCTTTPGNYAGKMVAGPIRFLEVLELHLGLSGIFPGTTERSLLLKERLSLLHEKGFIFYESFSKDPLGVSKRLLALWDSWRMSGWDVNDERQLPRRMKMLLDLSGIFKSIGPGLPDRILEVTAALEKATLPPMSIHLIDPLTFHPYLYQGLFKVLGQQVNIVTETFSPQAQPGSDLHKLQLMLEGKASNVFINDGSLNILHFPGDIEAANAVFTIQQAEKWNPVIINVDNSLLNGLHLSKNSPVCSWQTIAGNGQVSQLFFLATAMFKRPVDTAQVMAFLSAPISPFSKKIGRTLNNIFAAKPGFGNEDWNEAINDYLDSVKDEKGEINKKAKVAFWLQNKRFLNETTYEVALLNEIFSTLGKWAIQSANLEYYQLYAEQLLNLASLCSQLQQLLKDEGDTILPAKFERLQSELFSDVPSVIAEAQVGCADHVEAPGAVWSPAKDILWMNAIRYDGGSYLSKHWYQEEKEYFLDRGLPIHDESHGNSIYNHGLQRMIFCASEHLAIVVPSTINGAPAAKPFCLDEWNKNIDLSPVTSLQVDIMSASPRKNISLTTSFPTIELPVPVEYLHIKGESFSRACESFSSLASLIQHPAKWYLEYRLHLRYQPGVSLPAESQLRGTVADRVVQVLFKEENKNTAWWKDDPLFRKEVIKTIQGILEREGLPFLEVRAKRTLHEYKRTLVNSLCSLHDFINGNTFTIKGTQVVIEGVFGDTPFKGYADLVLTRNGEDCIVDLKWASSSNSYRERLREGSDLQLVLYQSLHTNATSSAYFLFNDGKIYMRKDNKNLHLKKVNFEEPGESVTLKNVYDRALNSLAYRRREIAEGKLEVAYQYPLEELAYEKDTEDKNLFLLKERDNCKQAPYDNDLDLFFGNIL